MKKRSPGETGVSISLEKALLQKADARAKELDKGNRSKYIARLIAEDVAKHVTITLSNQEMEAVERQAAVAGKTRHEYIVELIRADLAKYPAHQDQYLRAAESPITPQTEPPPPAAQPYRTSVSKRARRKRSAREDPRAHPQ
jgi:metal-responsive CopG/Arc/MetJ family transcriptional regulator